jgi:hypothetical protein
MMKNRLAVLSSLGLLAFAVARVGAQDLPKNAPHFVKTTKAPGLEVRFLDFNWDPEAFATLQGGGTHPVGKRSWVLARLLSLTNPFKCAGNVVPVGTQLLILNPARGGKGPTLELRYIDMRDVFTDLNVIAEPPPGDTYCSGPASFRKVDAFTQRLEMKATDGKDAITLSVHLGDQQTEFKLVRY